MLRGARSARMATLLGFVLFSTPTLASPIVLGPASMSVNARLSNSDFGTKVAGANQYSANNDGVFVDIATIVPGGGVGDEARAQVVLGTLPNAGPLLLTYARTNSLDFNSAAQADAHLSYSMRVLGPAGLEVPVLMHALLAASAGGQVAGAGASLGITQGFNNWGWNVCATTAGSCSSKPLDGLITNLDFITNQDIFITMSTAVGTQHGGSSNAFADPFFEIDPNFLGAHEGLAIVVSPLVGNHPFVTRVPEPMSLSLFGAGLALVIASGRRKKIA